MNGTLPGWLPPGLRERQDNVQLKLLCGADLLESFAVPGLWADKDVCVSANIFQRFDMQFHLFVYIFFFRLKILLEVMVWW